MISSPSLARDSICSGEYPLAGLEVGLAHAFYQPRIEANLAVSLVCIGVPCSATYDDNTMMMI